MISYMNTVFTSFSFCSPFMTFSFSTVIHTYTYVYMCVACVYNPLSVFPIVWMYTCLRLTTWSWITYQGAHLPLYVGIYCPQLFIYLGVGPSEMSPVHICMLAVSRFPGPLARMN